MKALILDGSGPLDEAARMVKTLLGSRMTESGWAVESLLLRDMNISGCTSCFGCWLKTPGICVIDDDGRAVAKGIVQSDLVIFLTPVTFGGYSSELKKALDRIIPIIMPYFGEFDGELHHTKRYDKYPGIISIGTMPATDKEAERIFRALPDRNARNLHSPVAVSCIVFQGESNISIDEKIRGLLKQAEVTIC